MFDVRKPRQKPMVIIRAATGNELTNYEKRKLANIEENAQENKIEAISVNGKRQYLDPINKEVQITLGGLANKDKIAPSEVSESELFFIECNLG